MTTWIIEPHDPLIVRDGRPFGPDPGARATSLPFPFPSTTTGSARSRAARNADGIFDLQSQEQLDTLIKNVRVRGPFLVQLANEGHEREGTRWLLPTPADALLLEGMPGGHERMLLLRQLVPLRPPENAQTDFEQKRQERQERLWLVGQRFADYDKKKPMKNAPSFWYWDVFQMWLLDPVQVQNKEMPLSALGLERLLRDQRLHVSIDSNKAMAKEGMLFETSGLEFTVPGRGEHRLQSAKRLALVVSVEIDTPDASFKFAVHPGLAGFAGERRIVAWRKSDMELPRCPDAVVQSIIAKKACRLILLTPACFEQGYHPTWLQTEATRYGIKAKIRAIAVQHPQVVSGWDLHLKKPKPSRRLAPAGTVLFLSIESSDTAAIKQWIGDLWMQSISDDEQDRRDGFGLTVVGTWSGEPVAME